jgi:hypothetical protein
MLYYGRGFAKIHFYLVNVDFVEIIIRKDGKSDAKILQMIKKMILESLFLVKMENPYL